MDGYLRVWEGLAVYPGKQARFDISFVLYVLGTGAWLAFTTFSGSTYALAAFADDGLTARIVQAGCFSLSFLFIAFIDHRRRLVGRYSLVIAVVVSFLLSLLVEAACALVHVPLALRYVSVAFFAFGSACGYCQWLRILSAQRYQRAQWFLALGSALLIAMMFAFCMIPDIQARRFVTFAALAPLSVALMAVNVRANPDSQHCGSVKHADAGSAGCGREMALPIVCAMALVLITPIASAAFRDGGSYPLPDDAIQPVAHACSLLILMVLWFVLKKDTTLPRFYCVFLPVFASLVFLLPLLDSSSRWIMIFVGDGSFFFVSILMVTTCLKASKRRGLSAVALYGLFAGCVYASNVVQLVLEALAQRGVLAFEPYAVALLLLYVLVIPAFFLISVNKGRKAMSSAEGAPCAAAAGGESDGSSVARVPLSDTESACMRIARKRGLTSRQSELLSYLALGRDVSYVAQALYLSPNTIRSYRKDLYAALGIHGKQELIDLVEAERTAHLEEACPPSPFI